MGKLVKARKLSSGRDDEIKIEVVDLDASRVELELASNAEAVTGTNANKVLTPAALAAAATGHVTAATTSAAGKVELATSAEAQTGTDTERAVTPKALADAVTTLVTAASTTAAGKVELATDAEAKAAAELVRALTPDNLAQGAPAVSGTLEAMFPQHYRITPALGTATAVHAAITLVPGAPTEVTTEITNPDFPRLVTVKGNQAGVAGNVVIDGTDIAGNVIQDTIALSDDSEVAGVKAFKTVTKITVPQRVAEGDTVSVGVDDVFGMPHVIPFADLLLVALFNSADDAGGSLAVNASLPLNLYTPAGTPDGAKHFDFYYLV